MARWMGGFASNYFVGNIIVIVAAGYFMPWSLLLGAGFSVAVILAYLGINAAEYGITREMIAPIFFQGGIAVFTYIAAVFSHNDRRLDLSLRMRLEEANKELKRVDAAKTRFFANVSHELRTPLTLMLGPVEALLRDEDEEERGTLLRSVLSNSRRMLRQVNLLLDTAKMESGQLVLESSQGDLGFLLEDLVSASRPHAKKRKLSLVTEGLEQLGAFQFDHNKMEMIAANLLSNALKFTPPGGTISIEAEDSPGKVAFSVEDTGPGIPSDQLPLIFDRFHQVDTSLSREEGTGLGLSLARELARLHGGDITVESKLGRGTKFRVVIPKKVQEKTERRRAPRRKEDRIVQAKTETLTALEFEERSRKDTLLADLRKPRLQPDALAKPETPEDAPRVLVVDDNEDLRSFLASQLARKYRIQTAADGVEGLEHARNLRPALIVADVMMPKMDGYELCKRLKADAGLAPIPVILVTAKAGSEAVVEGLEIGADDYVTKPFSIEELEARIAAHLRAKEIEKELHEKESRLAAIGQLTSALVHDLRNALMLVQGYSDLARSTAQGGGPAEALIDDLNQIGVATKRLQGMTSEILEYARGGAELQVRTVSVREYLGPVLLGLTEHLNGQGITVDAKVDLEPGLTAPIDPDRLQRVLENLAFNARDAILEHDGEKRVVFQAGRRGDVLEIRVADTGRGIDPAIAGRLFEPFTTTKRTKGTGLGLVTVRNLVKAHGGEIRVEPKSPEGGAAFTVVLPLGRADRDNA